MTDEPAADTHTAVRHRVGFFLGPALLALVLALPAPGLSPEAHRLAAVMALCAEEAGLKAVIGGHTDNVGDQVSNLGLSQRRAIAVDRHQGW